MHVLEANAYGNRVWKVQDSRTGRTICRCDSIEDALRIIDALKSERASNLPAAEGEDRS